MQFRKFFIYNFKDAFRDHNSKTIALILFIKFSSLDLEKRLLLGTKFRISDLLGN